MERNLELVDALRKVAAAKGMTVAQTAIAWVAGQGTDIVPVIGARRRGRLVEALGSAALALNAEAAIERAGPKGAAGARY